LQQTKRLERRCQYEERKQYDIRNQIAKELAAIKRDHQPTVERKRQLIDEYERERRVFIDWQREHHLPVATKSLSTSSTKSRKHAVMSYRTPLNSTKSSAGKYSFLNDSFNYYFLN
jgi:DNA primase